MDAATVALALVRPVETPTVWSGAGLAQRFVVAMFHRCEDVYFRPLLQADSLAVLRWRLAKLRWFYAAENRIFTVSVFALLITRPRKFVRIEDLDEAYAYLQQRLSESRFSEETVTNIDYAAYTAIRYTAVFLRGDLKPPPNVSLLQLAKLARVASAFDLYSGAVALAAYEPGLVKNPLVLKDLARSAVKASDAYVQALDELGLSIR